MNIHNIQRKKEFADLSEFLFGWHFLILITGSYIKFLSLT